MALEPESLLSLLGFPFAQLSKPTVYMMLCNVADGSENSMPTSGALENNSALRTYFSAASLSYKTLSSHRLLITLVCLLRPFTR